MTNELPGKNYLFDFGSLDCEGCEWNALQSIDWQNTAFGVFVVKADEHNPLKTLAIRNFLHSKGYTQMETVEKRSDWFVHDNLSLIHI